MCAVTCGHYIYITTRPNRSGKARERACTRYGQGAVHIGWTEEERFNFRSDKQLFEFCLWTVERDMSRFLDGRRENWGQIVYWNGWSAKSCHNKMCVVLHEPSSDRILDNHQACIFAAETAGIFVEWAFDLFVSSLQCA